MYPITPPSFQNTRTIGGRTVVYLVALRMTSSSAYSLSTFTDDCVSFTGTYSTFYGTFKGLSVFGVSSVSSSTQTINLVTAHWVPSVTVLRSVYWHHWTNAYTVFTNPYEATFLLRAYDSGDNNYYYQDGYDVRQSVGAVAYPHPLTYNIFYTATKSESTLNQNITWTRTYGDVVADGALRHDLAIKYFHDKLMWY